MRFHWNEVGNIKNPHCTEKKTHWIMDRKYILWSQCLGVYKLQKHTMIRELRRKKRMPSSFIVKRNTQSHSIIAVKSNHNRRKQEDEKCLITGIIHWWRQAIRLQWEYWKVNETRRRKEIKRNLKYPKRAANNTGTVMAPMLPVLLDYILPAPFLLLSVCVDAFHDATSSLLQWSELVPSPPAWSNL